MAKRKLSAFDSSAFGYARLADVTVRTKKRSRIDSLESEYVTPAFAMSDNTIDFTDARGLTNIWQYLQMQVSGFAVEPFNGGGATARFTRNEALED